ncbi:MAG: OsmC family protein [Hyphomicrobiaceae bacterium]
MSGETSVVEVRETNTGKFIQTARAGRHALTMDEPTSVGGNDAGPGPYDFLLMALGGCTAMTLRMYADRKKLALRNVAVQLSHRRVHAEDCWDCLTPGDGHISEIVLDITLEGDLSTEERQRLLEIAHKCPVHRTMTGEIKVRARLA